MSMSVYAHVYMQGFIACVCMHRPKEVSGVIPQVPPTFFAVIEKRSLVVLEPTKQLRLAGFY